MGWIGGSASASNENTSGSGTLNQQQYGSTTPIISTQATDAYGDQVGGVNASGATPGQQTALDWTNSQLKNSPIDAAAYGLNKIQYTQGQGLNNLNSGVLGGISTQAAPQMSVASAAPTSTVNAVTGASQMAPYSALYSSAVTDPALAAYDYGTDKNFSALDARTAGAGAFGNTRSGLGYSDLGAQSSLGRGQLASGLLQSGFATAAGLGQQDAGNLLTASGQNASNTQNNNEFNANLLQQSNAANLAAKQTNTGQQLQSTQQIAQNLATGAGLGQNILQNIITANGIDMQNAQALFQAGQITQDQLNQISAAAQQFNGSQFTKDTNQQTTNNSNTSKVSGTVSF